MPLPLRLLFSETIFPPCLLSPCCASVAFPVSLGCDLPVWFVFGFAGLRWFSRGWFSLCMVVFALSSVLTLLFLKREPTLSAMLVAAVFTAPFSFSVCISFLPVLVPSEPFLSASSNPGLPLADSRRIFSLPASYRLDDSEVAVCTRCTHFAYYAERSSQTPSFIIFFLSVGYKILSLAYSVVIFE